MRDAPVSTIACTLLLAASGSEPTLDAHAGDQEASDADPVVVEQDPAWLFVQAGVSGRYDGLELTLDNVPPTLIFAERPQRVIGHMSAAGFLDAWGEQPDSLAKNPPRAVLSTFGSKPEPTRAAVLLQHPKLVGSSIVYRVELLDGEIPERFGGASLFIDHRHPHARIAALIRAAEGAEGDVGERSGSGAVVVVEPDYCFTAAPASPSTAVTPPR